VVAGLVGTALWSYLLTHSPLTLIALSPVFRHLVLASPSVDTWALFAVGAPRHFAPDPFVYFLGRDYGPAAIDWVEGNNPSAGRMMRGLERLFAKVGPFALLIYPDLLVSTLAGAAKVPLPVFIVFNLLGTIGTIAVAKFFGLWLTEEIATLMAFLQRNLLAVTVVSILLVIGINWWSRRGNEAPSDGA
jgi:membrane protein DedA with SNARE-associated domain